MKHILIRYGELTLKGNNRHDFITSLIRNIQHQLKSYGSEIKYLKDRNSLTLAVPETQLSDVVAALKNVFGIYSISLIEKTERNEAAIVETLKKIVERHPEAKTIKLAIQRKDKSFPMDSRELTLKIAPQLLKQYPHLKVDLQHPDLTLEVIIKHRHVDIFDNRSLGAKGLPVGTSGLGLSLLSGGIDSPVAAYLAMKRGMKVDFIHFMTPPHTSAEALKKVFDLASQLAKYNHPDFRLFVVNFSDFLTELNHIPHEGYRIILMRRMFMRIANQLAKQRGHQALITGESLGQVASQTIESMAVINEVSDRPIMRPLVTHDKEDIIKIAKKIGTFETSILPFDDVCSMFVPPHPVTRPNLKKAQFNEQDLL